MELGSEFHIDLHKLRRAPNSVFQYLGDMNYCLFDSGRSALKAILRVMGDGNILLPEYICNSIIKCFPADRIIFYKLDDNLHINTDDLLEKMDHKTSVVFLMHYFGSLQLENTLALLRAQKEKYDFTIIEDTTHSIFSRMQTVGDYCIASLRKWFALPNGGIVYSAASPQPFNKIPRSTDNEKVCAMILKSLYLNGQLESKSEYRMIFAACEEKLDNQTEIYRISEFSEYLLQCHDVCEMAEKRTRNLNCLLNKLRTGGIHMMCDFAKGDCPFTLPVMVPDRDAFRIYLMENNIYCAIHWPFDGFAQEQRPLAVSLSNSILSLPIDQRYGEAEMEHLSTVITAYKGRLHL